MPRRPSRWSTWRRCRSPNCGPWPAHSLENATSRLRRSSIGRRPIFWGWKTSSRPRRRYDERQQYRGQSFFTARGTPSAEKNVIISKRRRVSVSGVTQVRDGSSPSEKATHAFAGSPGNSCSGLSAQWGLCELPNPQGVLISSPVKVSNRASVRGHRVAFERPGPTVILKVQCFSF